MNVQNMFSWFRETSTNNISQKQRYLGSAENALMNASLKYKGYCKVGEVLHLEGPYISLESFNLAIKCLQHRHPLLRCRLQTDNTKPNTFLFEDDETLELLVREIPRKRSEHLHFWREEWREREKDTAKIGQGLAEFWLLQDPEDINDNHSPREIVLICEHCISDGISLSTVAHELLIALSGENNELFTNSLSWPVTMETAIGRSLSLWGKMSTFGRFIFNFIYLRATSGKNRTARVEVPEVDFNLNDMTEHCHTETCYGTLTKEHTRKLLEKCRSQSVTVTSAVSSVIICSLSTLLKNDDNQNTIIKFSLGADTRRRCVPPVPNHDLSYQVSGIAPFQIPTNDIPTTSEGIWQLAKIFGDFTKTSIDYGQVLATGMIMGRIYEKTLGPPNFNELPTSGVSSWGVLPFCEQYGKWRLISMVPFANMLLGAVPFSTIQTVNDVLTIMYLGADPVIPRAILESLRDDTIEKLLQIIDN